MFNYDEIISRIDQLASAERVTKALLTSLSRDTLGYLVESGDVRPINKLLQKGVLTPMNYKTALLYFKDWVPFQILESDDDGKEFLGFGKAKRTKDAGFAKIAEFLEDPLNNIWTWAERNVQVEKKPFDLKNVTRIIEKALKEADTDSVIKAVMAGGIEAQAIIDLIHAQAEEAEAEEE